MSQGKKWKMTKKQLHSNDHHRNWTHHIAGGKKGHPGFKFFRNKKVFKFISDRLIHKVFNLEYYMWD